MKLLVVEDDELLQQGLALALTGEGYVCDCAATAAEANSLLITSQYSMVIPDLGLPDMDGAALLRQWRRQQIDLPVLILTARDATEDRVDGLDAGADDYRSNPSRWSSCRHACAPSCGATGPQRQSDAGG